MSKFGQKVLNTLRCLSQHNVPKFLDKTFNYGQEYTRIYSEPVLQKFIDCLVQVYNLKKNIFTPSQEDIKDLLKDDENVAYLFLLHIYNQAFSKDKEYFINDVLHYLQKNANSRENSNIQGCLCDNKDDDTLMLDDIIKNVPIDELYLLPSGRCIKIDELVMHLSTAQNKTLDPTFNGKDKLWTNGLELQSMIDTMRNYSYSHPGALTPVINKVIKDIESIVTKYRELVSQEMKDLLSETYFLFYFVESNNKEQVKQMLKKYNYPDLETFDKKKMEELFSGPHGHSGHGWQDSYNDDLSQFRSLLGFKIGYKILEEIPKEEKEAILFIGEWAGMAREGWSSLTMGTFCTKTYGTLVHRLSDILNGKE